MKLDEIFQNLNIFSFIINHDYQIESVSTNLEDEFENYPYMSKPIFDFFKDLFDNDLFSNKAFLQYLEEKVISCINSKISTLEMHTVTNDLFENGFSYRFRLGIDVYNTINPKAVIKFVEFMKLSKKDDLYLSVFEEFDEEFKGLNNLLQVGKFIIDYSVSRNIIYANDLVSELLGIPSSPTKTYYISRSLKEDQKYVIPAENTFFIKSDMLLKGEIQYLTDIWNINNKYLQIEAKVLKSSQNGDPILLGGIAQDITKYKEYHDMYHLNSIYDLAVTSGGIGIFYYDVDIHGIELFEANKIYADIVGLEPNELGLYKISDFESSIIGIEEEISTETNVKETLQKLLKGHVDGTTDDILKIRNLKTKEEIYLLSSSKIDERYEDGSPKKFGGFIIEITERIQSEKNKVTFAYTDETTQLPNKRKLIKDMRSRKQGIGIFIDLDDFKKINDKYGHLIGDETLYIFAQSMLEVSENYESIYPYRLYGDEFFIFISGNRHDLINTLYQEINKICNQKLKSLGFTLDFSLGYSLYSVGSNLDDFIKEADYKMYLNKITKKQMR